MLHFFTRRCLDQDKGPPSYSEMTPEERQHHILSKYCTFCGVGFRRDRTTSDRPTVHHNHLLKNSHSQSISLCSSCNLNTIHNLNRKVPLTVLTLNGKNFDLLLIAKAVIEFGAIPFPVLNARGDITGYKTLVRATPKILLKNVEEVLSIEFMFNCLRTDCRGCRYKKEQQLNSKRTTYIETCVFSRSVKCIDTMCIVGSGLDRAVQDMKLASSKDKIPLQETFKHTYDYARDRGLNHNQALEYCTTKLPMPFTEHFRSVEHLKAVKSPPLITSFRNELSNSDRDISETQYQSFIDAWSTFQCENLLQLVGKQSLDQSSKQSPSRLAKLND